MGAEINLDFTLKPAPAAEAIVVAAAAPILETTKNTLSRLVQRDEIDKLPVVTRNFNDLAALSRVTKTGVFGGVDISGNRDFQNAYSVDAGLLLNRDAEIDGAILMGFELLVIELAGLVKLSSGQQRAGRRRLPITSAR